MHYLKRLPFILIPLFILVYVFYFTTPPKNWEEASTTQILLIFVPILVLFTALVDLKLNYLPRSFILGLGVMIIAVLQALKQLTPLVLIGVLAASILATRLFPKIKLTHNLKIPKLTRLGGSKK